MLTQEIPWAKISSDWVESAIAFLCPNCEKADLLCTDEVVTCPECGRQYYFRSRLLEVIGD